MSLWLNTKRVARYGLIGFIRNGFISLSAIIIMIITLFVVVALMVGSAALSATLKQLTDKVDVTVYFIPSATPDQVAQLQQSLQALPEVASVTEESPDEALQQYKDRHKNDQVQLQALDMIGSNPFGAALQIHAKQTSQYEGIAKYIDSQRTSGTGAGSVIDNVNFYQNKTAIDNLTNIIETSRKIGLILAVVLGAASVLITFNTIRLAIYTARDEIGVMNLVGAGRWYVRGPFIVSGILYGLIAGIIVLLLTYPLTAWLGPGSESFLGSFNVFTYFVSSFAYLFFVVMASGIGLGAISSYLAVRRYLNT